MIILASLIILGFALIFVEMFIPGGIIGLVGGLLLIAALVYALVEFDPFVAFCVLIIELIGAAVLFWWWSKFFFKTFLGRMFVLGDPDGAPEGSEKKTEEESQDLVGQTGETVTPLRPAGVAKIGGHRRDVVTEGSHLEEGAEVVVVKDEGFRIVVRKFQQQS